jgi:GrpB-like predicted nucleotidyltransferase (UPF0157 family)
MHPYDPGWPSSFEIEQRRLMLILGERLVRPIEHIGSTAVPGLVAKPIIDMAALVKDIDAIGSLAPALAEISWLEAPEPGDHEARKLSLCSPTVELRTHHLHVVEHPSRQWERWIAFRDHLRAHPELSSEYGALKSRLAQENSPDPNDREVYRSGKSDWISTATKQALLSHGGSASRP